MYTSGFGGLESQASPPVVNTAHFLHISLHHVPSTVSTASVLCVTSYGLLGNASPKYIHVTRIIWPSEAITDSPATHCPAQLCQRCPEQPAGHPRAPSRALLSRAESE